MSFIDILQLGEVVWQPCWRKWRSVLTMLLEDDDADISSLMVSNMAPLLLVDHAHPSYKVD
jgi:hypothetical protein